MEHFCICINILKIVLVIDITSGNQYDGLCVNRIIDINRIMIATHAINDDLMHKFITNNHICHNYKSNEIIIVYRLSMNVILMFLTICYDEYHANSCKTVIFDPIGNNVGTFDVVICIINVNNTFVYFIDTLDLVIKPLGKYIFLLVIVQ